MVKKTLLPIFLFFLLSFYQSAGQELSKEKIDSIVNSAMSTMPNAGIAVAVVKDDKIIHAKGYGIASQKSQEKVNANTRFGIASNSKSFTGLALGILVDEGKLNWDDKVVDHIPEFKMYDPYVTAHFNITDLLTHRSGLDLGAGDLMFFPDGGDFTIDDVIKSFQYQKPISAFRTKFDYDNLLYGVAGEIVARVSGMSWAEFVEMRIMKPLNMNESAGTHENLKEKNNVANPHIAREASLDEFGYLKIEGSMNAAGGIYSSVNDMSKWLMLQLNKGKYGDSLSQNIISETNHAYTWKPQTNTGFNAKPSKPYRTHFRAYGLGWSISDKNGYVVLEHTGGLPGMLSSTMIIPELNAGIVVLTNADPGGYSFWAIRAEIQDLLLGVERKDWITAMKQRIESQSSKADSAVTAIWKVVKKAKTKNLNLDNFIGNYKDNWFGEITVNMKNDKLWFTSKRSPKLNGEMFYYQANTFAVKWEYQDMPCDALAIFNQDENGKAQSIVMKGISPNIDFSFDFQHLDLRRVD